MVATSVLESFSIGPMITQSIKKRCKLFYFLVICLFEVVACLNMKNAPAKLAKKAPQQVTINPFAGIG